MNIDALVRAAVPPTADLDDPDVERALAALPARLRDTSAVPDVARRPVVVRRRRRAHLAVELADALRRATPVDEATALTLQVRAALATLPADDREVLALTVWEELRPTEIAAVIGIAPGAVRVRLHRARSRLQAALAPTEEGPSRRVCSPAEQTA
jgi:hypothetical protein